MIHSMVAHLDAVTSLAVDPNGIYLMSGSKVFLILLCFMDFVFLLLLSIWQKSNFVFSHFLFFLQTGHDCSIRLWNLDSKTCVQEITAHRKKLDESIYDVAFHPSKAYIASAGADALAKVFVWHSRTNLHHNSRSVWTKKRERVTAINKVTNKTLHLICLSEGS